MHLDIQQNKQNLMELYSKEVWADILSVGWIYTYNLIFSVAPAPMY